MNRAPHTPTAPPFYVLALSLVVGCAAIPLRPGAERVMVTRLPPPSDCKFVTTLVAQQGDAIAGKFTSNRALAEGAMNDMKNQAQGAGANYVLLETTTAGNTISGGRHGVSGEQTDVTHVGNAFLCPSAPASTSAPDPASQASRMP
ncbi:MAG TPA: DUF4156 domain-containing protein [Polyangiaceae bacterium]|nr:DUF4156 domain-containing protein [Polyangiaceae bacterium]